MIPFTTHTGLIAILNRGNIDTDQIIPKEHLKSIKRTGFGEHLFSDWRYLDNGKLNPDFELNQPRYNKASILVTGNNFGCGSSREHAVWAIVQYGFRAVIAPRKEREQNVIPGFADIFYNNSSKNGLLLIELKEDQVTEIVSLTEKNEGLKAHIDLSSQKVTINLPTEKKVYDFAINEGIKKRLLDGLDEIGQTEAYSDAITQFEKKHNSQFFG